VKKKATKKAEGGRRKAEVGRRKGGTCLPAGRPGIRNKEPARGKKKKKPASGLRIRAATRVLPVGAVDLVLLIGCGGTGSILAEHLARMIAGFRLRCRLVLCDGDKVVEANITRQGFLPCEIGQNKAVAMATRLAGRFGIEIAAVADMFRRPLCRPGLLDAGTLTITTVDTLRARWEVAQEYPALWMDCGNELHHGQAIVGTTSSATKLRECHDKWGRQPYALALPNAAAVNPDIEAKGRTAKAGGDDLNCAAMPFDIQGFGVNAMAAQAGAIIAKQVLVDAAVKTPAIFFDAAAGRMTPRLITRDWFELHTSAAKAVKP
jgi:hypothetical protein